MLLRSFFVAIKPFTPTGGHDFHAKFHWHVADLGLERHYIKVHTSQPNGKVEHSHLTAPTEFYHLLFYKDDVDLLEKLSQWDNFYNF